MTLRTVIAVLVVVTGVAAGGYVFYNNMTVIVNAPAPEVPEQTATVTPAADFRDRIPGYNAMTLAEKRKAVEAIYKNLEGEEKKGATKELVRIGRAEMLEKAAKPSDGGYVPPGWED